MAVPAPPTAGSGRRLLPIALLCAVLTLSACAGSTPTAAPTRDTPTASATEPAETVTANATDGCVDEVRAGVDYFPDKVTFEHATGVTVTYADTYKVVEVTPAGGSDRPIRYVLVQCGTEPPPAEGKLADAQVIEVPAAEVISMTTTNLPHFDELGAVDTLQGVGTGSFVSTPSVAARVAEGTLDDFATVEGQPDTERIIGADPDLLIIDGFGDTVLDDVGRFVDAGVPTAINVDFTEPELLGRAEWLKFTALFLNAEAAANAAFDEIASAYAEVAAAAAGAPERPTVFANQPFEGTWFMPGGASYFANAVADAGGDYVFDDDDSTAALELDFETVLDRAGDADVWLQAGSVAGTLDDLLAADERFDEFKAFRDGQVWAYDLATNPGGGNAVFETAYTRADLFLSDLVEILHPDVLDHELRFFGRVPAGEGR